MKRFSEDTVRTSYHKGKRYEFSRVIDVYPDRVDVEITARVWTGHSWFRLHRWTSETEK